MDHIKQPNAAMARRMDYTIQCAKELLLERKIDEVTMAEIALKAEIGVASLYRYYETKEAIVIEVATRLWMEIADEYIPKMKANLQRDLSGIQQFEAFLDLYVDLFHNHQEFILFLADFDNYCVKQHIGKERLRAYEGCLSVFKQPYLQALERGQKDGTVTAIGQPEILYLTVNHMMMSFLSHVSIGEILYQDAAYADEIQMAKRMILQFFGQNREGKYEKNNQ